MIKINRKRFSRIFWDNIFSDVRHMDDAKVELRRISYLNDLLREDADYNTGSVSIDAMSVLYSLSKFFQTKVIAEVGTFIGNSTCALALGAPEKSIVHTCDASNDLNVSSPAGKTIRRYPRFTSTQMFQSLISENIKADMIFLDGRLSGNDKDLIGSVMRHETLFALDDFEGIEKGVANAMLLMPHKDIGAYYHLIYPPEDMDCHIAALVPKKLVEWTNQ